MSGPPTLLHLARAVFTVSEAYCAERRCAVIAPGRSTLPRDLLAAGARSVHHYATDAERATWPIRAERTVLVRDLPTGDFDVREGAFDLVVVESLAALADVPAWLGRFRRLVGASGVFVAGAPRECGELPGGPAFGVHELDEIVSVQFAWVDLRGVASFHGLVVSPIGVAGVVGDFVLHPLDDGRAAPEELVVVASQRSRSLEPTLILEVPSLRSSDLLVAERGVEPANDTAAGGVVDALRDELARAHERHRDERADLIDTIALREGALRSAEAECDRLRREVDELTAHLDRALSGAVPAHLARLEALADKDRPRVVESPMAVAERARFEAELAAADAARSEADSACLRAEDRLRASELERKRIEADAAQLARRAQAEADRFESLALAFEAFAREATADRDALEAKLRAYAGERARAAEAERAVVRFLAADRLRTAVAPSRREGRREDEAELVRRLLRTEARSDTLALEIQELRARIARIVDAVDDAATSSVDTESPEPRLAAVSPASAASSLPAAPGPQTEDG
jgi:hypothetical protein